MERFIISKKFIVTGMDGDVVDPDENEQNEKMLYEQEQDNNEQSDDDEEEEEKDIPAIYLQGHYILYDENHDKEYLINDTIKYFIDKFSSPKTKAEVVKEIEAEVKSNNKTIEETCSHFFEFLCKKKILVPENYEEPALVENSLFEEGDSIDGLTILKVISNRRYTEIYLAYDKTHNCNYVIKLLNRSKTSEPKIFDEELRMLEREYSFLQNVEDISSICKVYSFNKMHEQHPYIILEYIKGNSLHRFLKETQLLTKTICFRIIKDILQAFSLLHKKKLIHGDIHSSNILITEDNSVKIIDMGLSVNVEEIEKNELVKFGGVIYYMPPERINLTTIEKFSKEPDLYSDVYQIGMLIYLIIYNKTPFKGFIWEELAQNIKSTNPAFPDLSFLNYTVPRWLINIVKKCLAKNPVERFSNATEIFENFETHVFKEKNIVVT